MNRRLDGLKLFRPTEQQEPFFTCKAHKILVTGGQRCLPGDAMIYDPVAGIERRLDTIREPFHVWSRDPATGKRVIAKAEIPFTKGVDLFFRYYLSNGKYMDATADHQVLCSDLTWRGIGDVASSSQLSLIPSTGGVHVPAFPRNAGDRIERNDATVESVVDIVHATAIMRNVVWDFEVPSTGNYEHCGVLSHNSGKTVAAAVRFAAFMRDMPVTLRSGRQISYRRPRDQNGHVICWIIGYNWSHLVDTIKKKLFDPGLYSIIRDPQTKEWRCVDPENPYDIEHHEMWKDAPPLIPSHEMEMSEFSWRLMRCTAEMTKNRGTIRGIPSSGDLTTGDAVTCIWIDEHIEIPEYFGDWQTRLASTEGYLFWSAFDNMWANDAFLNLYDECEREAVEDDPLAVRFALRQRDNPHISKRGTQIAMSGLSDDEKAARDEGIHQIDKILMYPWFSETHHVIKKSTPVEHDPVVKILQDNHMRPPADWTKYLVLDPGTLHPALLAVAVPPPQIGPFAIAFQEVFPGRMDAEGLAAMAAKTFDWCWFEAFIIDNQAGQKTPEGFSQTIFRRYSDMFQKYQLLSRQTGASFWIGSRDVPARTQAVTSMLVPCYPSGKPRIRIVENTCPHLIDQLKRYRRHVDKATRIVSEKPAERQTIDLAVCLEYFCARDPGWYPQPDLPPNASPVQTMIYRRIKELQAEKDAGQTVFHCGPGMIS